MFILTSETILITAMALCLLVEQRDQALPLRSHLARYVNHVM